MDLFYLLIPVFEMLGLFIAWNLVDLEIVKEVAQVVAFRPAIWVAIYLCMPPVTAMVQLLVLFCHSEKTPERKQGYFVYLQIFLGF